MPLIVTLLSDFGSGSPYPGQMKAVLASSCDAVFIDITHDIPRHDVRAGAYVLSAVARTTPAGTVHLAVVDPGVGTTRRPLIVASGGQCFVGPDNGLLLPAAKRVGRPHAYVIQAPEILRSVASSTFHGRDLFAPVAAQLVLGTPPQALGGVVEDPVDLTLGAGYRAGDTLHGEVLYVDAFGNLITNIPAAELPGDGSPIQLTIGRRRIRATAARTYGNVARGGIAVVPGSDGLLEIAVREGSAAARLAMSLGAKVRIEVARTTARPSALMKKEQSKGRRGIGTEDGLADA